MDCPLQEKMMRATEVDQLLGCGDDELGNIMKGIPTILVR